MSNPTLEEVLDEIKAAGLKTGAWGALGGAEARPLFLKDQIELAQKLQGLLRKQEEILSQELQQTKEALHRIQHGGGA